MVVRISAVAVAALVVAGCTGDIQSPLGVGGAPGVGPAGTPGAPGTVGPGSFLPGNGTLNPGSGVTPGWVTARIRRLTGAEYDASVQALLQTAQTPSSTFPTEVRQSGFSRNDAQIVDTVYATAAQDAAEALAAEAVSARLAQLAPCPTGTDPMTCAQQFIEAFAAAAFRRPLTSDDRTGLLAVYQAGSTPDGYAAGISLVITAVLQAPSFLYVTELGDGAALATLTPYEIASELAYLFSGAPPDAALLQDAQSGALLDADTRTTQARRLIAQASAHTQVEQLVIDWLGLYRVEVQSKDTTLYPGFTALQPQLLVEARGFTDDVFFTRHGGISQLLGADFTDAPAPVATAYGLAGAAPQALASTTRRGILSQAAFLAAYSNISDSGPFHRGAAIIRQVLCDALPDPSTLNIVVTPPPPDPTLTTRERFAAHANNPACLGCHSIIDPAGFAFEGFDAEGLARTTDNGKPIDTSGELDLGDVSGPFSSNVDFVAKLAASPGVEGCFGANVDRFALARTDPHVDAAFAQLIAALPNASRGDPVELLVALAGSDLFVKRSSQ